MVTCSASNSVYFNPYKFTYNGVTKEIIGGGSIAESPSLYAFFTATEFLQVPPSKISMTVIGGITMDTDKIQGTVNILQWADRIVALTSPVKRQTQ